MSTTLYLTSVSFGGGTVDGGRAGTTTALLDGSSMNGFHQRLETTRGTGIDTTTASTVAGPVNGVDFVSATAIYDWITPPLAAGVTISGAVTGNFWAQETGMAANAAINFILDKMSATDLSLTQIVKSARTTELGFSGANTVQNFTATPGAGVACNRGDRLRVRAFIDDAGTMGTGFIVGLGYSGATPAADGDTFITLTENVTFEDTSATPAGSTLYLTTTSAGINPGSASELEAWTSRGSGSTNAVTNYAAGPTSGIQITDSAGGTALEWYSRQLQAFTLGGLAKMNVRALASGSFGQLRGEIAICASDGTSPTVWGTACAKPASGNVEASLSASEVAWPIYVAGDDTSVTNGQRLRFRIYLDDNNGRAMSAGSTGTVSYAGTTGGAAGDTFVILPQTLTEYVVAGGNPLALFAEIPFIPRGRSF